MTSKYHILNQLHMDDEVEAKVKRKEKMEKILERCAKYITYKVITTASNPNFIKYLASLIENTPNIKTYHIDKLQLFIDVVKILFPLTEQDAIGKIIEILEYLLKIKDIKRIPLLHRMGFCSHLAIKDVSTNFFSPVKTKTNGKKQYSRNDC
jgi:hypothetical protein